MSSCRMLDKDICLPLGVDDVSWESWWLVTTAIYDEGDGLILLNDTHSCCVSLGFAGIENMKTCKVLLWIVFSNLMDIFWLKVHSINVIVSGVLKGYYQGVGGPNCYPLYRSLYAFGLDACLYRSKLKLKWTSRTIWLQLAWVWCRLFNQLCLVS
jgi:hypothetical protein